MEHTEDMVAMLNQITSPAFLVKDGIITQANAAALQRQLRLGEDIQSIMITGKEEYAAYTDGCLYLDVLLCGSPCSVSITNVNHYHLFILEQEEDQAELQSMALAAQALRSPLSNVLTVADRLFPQTGSDKSQETQDQIARINRGLYQMLRILCNMSDAYRYSSEKSLRTELREVGALVEEMFLQAAPLIEHTGVTLRYSIPPEPIHCLVDSEKLERAISNMLSNSVKFTSPGGFIDAKLVRKGRMLYLTIQDTGCGIADHLKGGIYNRYLRLPGLEDSRFGIGLGMVLVRRAAAAHGGTVLMEQGNDFGLRLTMTIPIRQSPDPGVRSPMIHVDYTGERSHMLVELSDCLPADLYRLENVN